MPESIPMFIQLTEVSGTDGKPIGPVLVNLFHVSRIVAPSESRPVRYTTLLMDDGTSIYTDAPFEKLAKNCPVIAIFLSRTEDGQISIPAGALKSGTAIHGSASISISSQAKE